MASQTDICNMALSILGVSTIMSMEQNTPDANACRRTYDLTRDTVLTSFDWRFATQSIRLSLLSEETLNNWEYVFRGPVNALKIQKIYDETGTFSEGIPFDVGFEGRIFCNRNDAIAQATIRMENEGMYPAHFVDVFSKAMAVALSGSLQNIASRQDMALLLYDAAIESAYSVDFSQHKAEEQESGLILSRGGGWK